MKGERSPSSSFLWPRTSRHRDTGCLAVWCVGLVWGCGCDAKAKAAECEGEFPFVRRCRAYITPLMTYVLVSLHPARATTSPPYHPLYQPPNHPTAQSTTAFRPIHSPLTMLVLLCYLVTVLSGYHVVGLLYCMRFPGRRVVSLHPHTRAPAYPHPCTHVLATLCP